MLVVEMKRLFQKLYENIEVTLLMLLSISFVTGMYMMMNKAGGPTTMDYVAQIIIALIIILDIIFLISSRKKENSK
jgi:heme/copper-type cytochrome/quinol oxidase subunit 4